jgi:hypothetical protein
LHARRETTCAPAHTLGFSPGPDRNQHRQIALSLGALFKNKKWLDAHTTWFRRTSPESCRSPLIHPKGIAPRTLLRLVNDKKFPTDDRISSGTNEPGLAFFPLDQSGG